MQPVPLSMSIIAAWSSAPETIPRGSTVAAMCLPDCCLLEGATSPVPQAIHPHPTAPNSDWLKSPAQGKPRLKAPGQVLLLQLLLLGVKKEFAGRAAFCIKDIMHTLSLFVLRFVK